MRFVISAGLTFAKKRPVSVLPYMRRLPLSGDMMLQKLPYKISFAKKNFGTVRSNVGPELFAVTVMRVL